MPGSGIVLNEDGLEKFFEMKKKKNLHWVKYGIDDTQQFIVVQGSKYIEEGDFDYADLENVLSPSECAYLILDLKWKDPKKGLRQKLVFIHWVPDNSPVKQRMLFASSKEDLLQKFEGVQVKIQATDVSEVTYDVLKAAAKTTMTEGN